ncbi:MAG: DNA translocase FtsK [Thermodesulfobacteriota bacterium]|nr:DNA translocase FtsK [Thermodesulfobacteriota bacterium]
MPKGLEQHKMPQLWQEALSVCGIFLAAFLLLCLSSFSPYDPSATTTCSANWGGQIGGFIAGILMDFLGISSFWLIFIIICLSIQSFFSTGILKKIPFICLGCTGILISSCCLLMSPGREAFDIFGRIYPAGGWLGENLFGLCRKYFGAPGSILLFVSLFIISLMTTVRFSPYFFGKKLVRIFDWSKNKLRRDKKNSGNSLKKMAEKIKGKAERPIISSDYESTAIPSLNEPIVISSPDEKNKAEFQPLPVSTKGKYRLPGIDLLNRAEKRKFQIEKEHYFKVSKQLEAKLSDFGVGGKVEGISPGPVITTYEFSPAPGVKISKIVSLANDLALGLKTESVRIVGTIPGKAALGLEVPNPKRLIVNTRDIMGHESFIKSVSRLTLGLGMDVVGNPVIADLTKMPHLLIAGATGSGKSVAVNTIICSILYKASPDEVRLLMIDPKRIELSSYEAIPHLLHPVVVDPKMANRALQWAVREMERRYKLMEEARVKNISGYNAVSEEKIPLIVIIIDELADLMMVSSKEVEDSLARLAQMARAAGMHLIVATQRPSVDVLTGLIKANFPTRISFKVASKIDSKTILDGSGAEQLLGSGDMLFLAPGTARLQRIHGAYIVEEEILRIVDFLKKQGDVTYDESVMQIAAEPEEEGGPGGTEDYDEKYDEAVSLVCETGHASISLVQRRLRVGYNRAARMIEIMEKEGIVGPSDGSKPREVLVRKNY